MARALMQKWIDKFLRSSTKFGSGPEHLVGVLNALGDQVKVSLIAGGAAGTHTLTGVATNDKLVSVMHFTAGYGCLDLTSEFSISAANTITNAGGTDTSGDQLWIIWLANSYYTG